VGFCATFFVRGTPVPKGSMKGMIHVRGLAGSRCVVVLTQQVLSAVGGGWRAQPIVTHDDRAAVKAWAKEIKLVASAHAPERPLDGAVGIDATFVVQRPKSVSEKKRPHAVCKPDVDKYLRLLQDALTGVLYVDDAQVVRVQMAKVYGEDPGVQVRVWEIGAPAPLLEEEVLG
jgi:Holliday junction resolvase RusA-like endonuclease